MATAELEKQIDAAEENYRTIRALARSVLDRTCDAAHKEYYSIPKSLRTETDERRFLSARKIANDKYDAECLDSKSRLDALMLQWTP